MAKKLVVEIVGDASSLNKAFSSATKSGSSFGSGLVKLGKVAAVGTAAAFAGLAVVIKQGFDELGEGQKVAAQTAAVLKSTGGEANVTAKQIDEMAQSLSQLSGVDDEVIGAGENMLLTFTNIRNEVGKGNDIFNQATSTLLDMSTALGTEPRKAAIQLGKALNDPVKGITALTRVGVAFTDGQKAQIKAMVAAGDTMGAQKVILKELNKEFGGSAKAAGETLPGQLNKLRNGLEEAAAGMAQALLPFLLKFVGFVNDNMPRIQAIMAAVGQGIAKAFELIGTVVSKVVELLGGGKGIGTAVDGIASKVQSALPAIASAFNAIVSVVRDDLFPIFQKVGQVVGEAISNIGAVLAENGPQIRQIFENLGTVIGNLAKVILPILEFALTKVLPTAIRVLIPILLILTTALAKVSDVVRIVAQVFIGAFKTASSAVQTAINFMRPLISGIVTLIKGVVDIVAGIFTGDWSRVWQGMKTVAQTALKGLIAYITTVPGLVLRLALAIGTAVVTGIVQGLANLATSVEQKLNAIGRAIADVAAKVPDWAAGIGRAIVDGIIRGITGIPGRVKDAIVNGVKSGIDAALPTFLHSPQEIIGVALVDGVVRGWNERSAEGGLKEAMVDKVNEAIDAAQQAIVDKQGAFASAFDGLVQNALSAFDKLTSEFETRTERAIRKQDAARANAERQSALAAAQTGLAEATAGGDPEAIKQAQQALDDALFAIQRANQEKRAAAERKQYEESRERQRVNLENQLARLQQSYLNQELTTQQFHNRLIAIFKKFEVPLGKAGKQVGFALAAGLNESFGAVQNAARALAKEILDQFSRIKVIINVDLSVKGGDKVPGRAAGGPVRAGMPYIVGEAGPELFVPKSSGYINSNESMGQMTGGGVNVYVYGDVTGDEIVQKVREGLLRINLYNPGSAIAR